MFEKKKKMITTFVTFFDGFVAKKMKTTMVAFFNGFVTKEVTTTMSSPSSMVVVL
jgi:hypothetical protein